MANPVEECVGPDLRRFAIPKTTQPLTSHSALESDQNYKKQDDSNFEEHQSCVGSASFC